jgi:putative hydrolase of the HAD superfamily
LIEAITFDLWNTLFHNISYTNARKELIKQLLNKNGFHISDTRLHRAFNNNFNFLNPRFKTTQYRHIYTQTRIKNMFQELEVDFNPTIIAEINNSFGNLMLSNPPLLRKGVFDTLSELSSNYNIGLISDTGITPGRIIREVLNDYSILGFFDVTVFSDETGYYKPHPIAFKTALSYLDCFPINAVHVGDLLATDIKGAVEYNMRAVWIRDPQTMNPGEVLPDYEISEIPEILDVILKLDKNF